MAWIGGTTGAGGAVAAGVQKQNNGKYHWVYLVSFVAALIVFLIVFSQVWGA
jgi:hypothetical protein